MSSETQQKKPGWTFWATVTSGLLLLYVASVGPAHRIALGGGIDSDFFFFIYSPLLRLAWAHEATGNLLFGYIELWRWTAVPFLDP